MNASYRHLDLAPMTLRLKGQPRSVAMREIRPQTGNCVRSYAILHPGCVADNREEADPRKIE